MKEVVVEMHRKGTATGHFVRETRHRKIELKIVSPDATLEIRSNNLQPLLQLG